MRQQAGYATNALAEEERDRVVLEHMPQVKAIARRIHERLPQHVPLEDMVHAGVLGLMDAYQKYDASKNVQFHSYAAFRIRGAILDSLRELDWSPRELRRKSRQIEDTALKLSQELGRAATDLEVAERMGLPLAEFQKLLSEIGGLDMAIFPNDRDDASDEGVLEQVPDSEANSPLACSIASEQRAILVRAIEELPPNERQVLALYYFEELTMKEVGAVLGVGESRVSQIHSMALVRLRGRMHQIVREKKSPKRMSAHA
jgi:RNA polymerase sigma factor for flagellar operon FliA